MPGQLGRRTMRIARASPEIARAVSWQDQDEVEDTTEVRAGGLDSQNNAPSLP